jgi:hypothetical protein
MSGNRGAGIGVSGEEGRGNIEVGAIPEAPAIAETIYVGRASFHMEVGPETGEAAASVVVTPAPAPSVDSGAWFRETPVPAAERTAIVDFSSRLRGGPGPNDVPGPYGGAGSGGYGSRKLISSRWSLGLPLVFGAFFCGLLLSPLAASSLSGVKGVKGTNVPAGSSDLTTSRRSSAPSAARPVAPSTPAAPAAPVIAPITPIAPSDPARSRHSNLVAGIFTNRSTGPGPGPVWGRALKKTSPRKAAPARRPAHVATMVADSAFDRSQESTRASRTAKHAWVDPWADN